MRIFIILSFTSLLYTLPIYNKYWAPFDEGIILVAAQRLFAGEMPYKDFFLAMYPPGQIYVLASLFKTFTPSLIIGRIYTVLLSVGIAVLTFYITRFLTKRVIPALLAWFVVLVSSAPRLGAIPAPIWPGIFWALCALYLFMLYLEKGKNSFLLFAGVCAGCSVLFRHDIGIFLAISILVSFFTMPLRKKKIGLLPPLLFTTVAIAVILPVAVYFIKNSASYDVFRSLFLFPFVHRRTAGIPFPAPCLNPNMIFHGSLHFIKINQYYIPPLVYLLTFFYIGRQIFKKRYSEKEPAILVPVLLFGILTFNQVIIRTDPAHLLTVIQPSAILFGFLISKTLLRRPSGYHPKLLLGGVVTGAVLILFALLAIKNVDKYIKNSFRKIYKGDIIKARFDKGSVYIPKDEIGGVLKTLEFIRDSTSAGERIYIGNTAHWKDDFGGSVILYFLANRLPSTKYYELLPGLITAPDVQNEIKKSLNRHNVNLLVLQDVEAGALDRAKIARDKLILDEFIKKNFQCAKKFGRYNIYVRSKKK